MKNKRSSPWTAPRAEISSNKHNKWFFCWVKQYCIVFDWNTDVSNTNDGSIMLFWKGNERESLLWGAHFDCSLTEMADQWWRHDVPFCLNVSQGTRAGCVRLVAVYSQTYPTLKMRTNQAQEWNVQRCPQCVGAVSQQKALTYTVYCQSVFSLS